jgi:hypothetical protein
MRFTRRGDRRALGLWRTTAFRLTLLYGAVFAAGVVTLLGLIYVGTEVDHGAERLRFRAAKIQAPRERRVLADGPLPASQRADVS